MHWAPESRVVEHRNNSFKGVPTMNISVFEKRKMPSQVKNAAEVAGVLQEPQETALMKDLGLLTLRLTTGGLLAGHGAQKLFGWFSGPGLKGFAGFVEAMGLKPGTFWAGAAAMGEFGGGVLNALGLLHPLGPLGMTGSMVMATVKVHWGKPIWATAGGAELPVTNIASALALTLTGPGRLSLDRLFGIRLPRALVVVAAVLEAIMLAIGIMQRPQPVGAGSAGDQKATNVGTTSSP
jgi:putative oxidoreductase